jgi:hypothetical protein
MKKKIIKTVEEEVEVTLEDVAQEIIDDYAIPEIADAISEGYIRDFIDEYIQAEEAKLSDSEIETLESIIISKVTPLIEEARKEELETLSNREKILELIGYWLYDSGSCDDYRMLSTGEILDEIIKNGNK